jgi:hypothetical protein
MELNEDVVIYWLKSQSTEIQLLLQDKSFQELKCLIEVITSFTEEQCKSLMTKLPKTPDSLVEFQSLF